MELVHSSWLEIEEYLKFSDGIIIPTGSIEQHGPVGLIGQMLSGNRVWLKLL